MDRIQPRKLLSDSFKHISSEISKVFHESQHILITAHFSPDGDNVGSCLALYNYFRSIGKTVSLFNEDPLPSYLKFLPGSENWQVFSETNQPDKSVDVVVVLDSSDLSRIGKIQEICKDKKLIEIDHHVSNSSFAEWNLLDFESTATAEILYNFFITLDIPITLEMALPLFTGIASDTGFFRFSSVHSGVFHIAAHLMDIGVNPALVDQKLNQSRDPEYLKLLSRALASLEWYADNKIAVATLNLNDFQDVTNKDTEGIVNMIGIIESVEVCVFIREKDSGVISASLRSKNYVDVNQVLKPLNGGGHVRAAGCRTKELDIDSFKNAIVNEILKAI